MNYREAELTERQFATEYLLARARGHIGGLSATSAIREARKAWVDLQKIPNNSEETSE